ncbi:MAG TPA: ATP-grasp domain-containing protein [Ktedonobacterales bacterium]|jgi:hypothetical protein
MVVVLSEAPPPGQGISANAQELAQHTEVARLLGCRVITIPTDFAEAGSAANALAYVAPYAPPVPGVWIGYIPALARYREVYTAALAKGIRLVNSPAQHHRAIEGDQALAALGDLTPATVVVRTLAQCQDAVRQLGFPVFVKGAVKSRKEDGWAACVAANLEELRALVAAALAPGGRAGLTRGRVLVRRLVPLRRVPGTLGDFPISREYRVFLYRARALAHGFYWEDYDDAFPLTAEDERALLDVARAAARRLRVPLLIVDVGQLDTGAWTVIEAGDAQFAGLSRVPPLRLWNELLRAINGGTARW